MFYLFQIYDISGVVQADSEMAPKEKLKRRAATALPQRLNQ